MNPSEPSPAAIFAHALELAPGPMREEYLDQRCGIGTQLRRDVEALIHMEEDPAGFFAPQNTGAKTRFANGVHEPEGNRIGRYKLLQRIGEGGCGIVYLAEQTSPVRRKVALKIIKLGLDSRSVVARFEAERQALALMDHPNIARVLDAGATEIDRPYFVMELVRGTKITTYCDDHKLPIAERLSLFIQVCQAVQHAHQKGIIHRDLKPSNILVTVRDGVAPTPKVIDFGVAKATGDIRLTDKTLFTQMEILVGTPAYMSPEQADLNSSDIDTRSDLYSLGVLLYELLTGRPPFDADVLATSSIDAMRKTICEKEPIPPSTRVSSLLGKELTDLAQRHASYPPRMISMIRGDLDWIVLKALDKDRNRRYQTANALANDVERYLRDELVMARPPSQAYRFQKLVHRHRIIFGAATAVLLSLVAGLSVAVWQFTEKSTALDGESKARNELEKQISQAEARAYASDIRLIQGALSVNNLGRAKSLLEGIEDRPKSLPFRGWEWRYLWDQCQSEARFEMVNHHPDPDPIIGLSLSADGKFMVTTEHGHGDVILWDFHEHKQITPLVHNPNNALAEFSPTQPIVAFSTEAPMGSERHCGVSFWNLSEYQAIRSIPLNDRCVGLSFSSDGTQLLTYTTGNQPTLTLWRTDDGSILSQKPVPRLISTVGTPFAASADLKTIACVLDSGSIQLIESSTGQALWSIQRPNAAVDSIALSPDGKSIALGIRSAVPWIELLSTENGALKLRLDGHTGYAIDLLFSPDSLKLWSASSDQTIRFWNLESGITERILRGHRKEVWRLALGQDQRSLVSGSKDGQILVWDAAAPTHPRERQLIPNRGWFGWRFTTNSASIIGCDQDGKVWRSSTPRFDTFEELLNVGAHRTDVLIDEEARQVAASDSKGNVRIWDISTRKPRIEFTAGTEPVHFWKFTNKGQGIVLLQDKFSTLREWSLVSGNVLPGDDPNRDWHIHLRFPTSRRFLSTGWRAPLPNANNAKEIQPEALTPIALDGALSPDGNWIAFGHHGGSVQILDRKTRNPIVEFEGFLQGLHSVCFSPDGKRIAAGSDGREAIKIWDTQTRQELVTLEGQGTSLFLTEFSPDGQWLGSANANGDINLWRAPSWEEIRTLSKAKAENIVVKP